MGFCSRSSCPQNPADLWCFCRWSLRWFLTMILEALNLWGSRWAWAQRRWWTCFHCVQVWAVSLFSPQRPGFYEPKADRAQYVSLQTPCITSNILLWATEFGNDSVCSLNLRESRYMRVRTPYMARAPEQLTVPGGVVVFLFGEEDRDGMINVIYDGQVRARF